VAILFAAPNARAGILASVGQQWPAHSFPFGIRIGIQKQVAEKQDRHEVSIRAIALFRGSCIP
jgi:hypothetical protein